VSDRVLAAAIRLAALAGAGIAGYLVYVRSAGAPIACTNGGCALVQGSRYAEVLGVPVALLGLLAYLGILGTTFGRGEWWRASGGSLALAGVGFGGYLLYVQLAVIGAVCEWCVASDAVMTVLAALTLLRLRAGLRVSPQAG
jgi:uncharacterized membrane protein